MNENNFTTGLSQPGKISHVGYIIPIKQKLYYDENQ